MQTERSEGRWISSEGWPVMALAGLLTIILTVVSLPLGAFALGLLFWLRFILRMPSRHMPDAKNLVLAPADGVILEVTKASPEEMSDQTSTGSGDLPTRLTISTALTDAQLQRAPVAARVTDNFLIPGLFGRIDDIRLARRDNERREITLETETGDKFLFVQLGSSTARKLVCRHVPGKFLSAGAPLGMACIGGIIDLYVPSGYRVDAKSGQHLIAGETILARRKG